MKKEISARLALILLLSAFSASAAAKNDKPGSLKEGNGLLREGHYEEAIASFNEIGVQSSLKREPYRLLGLSTAYFELGKFQDSISAAQKALELQQDLRAAWNNLGSAQARLGQRAEAVATYEKAIAVLQALGQDTRTLQLKRDELAKSPKQKASEAQAKHESPTAKLESPQSPLAASSTSQTGMPLSPTAGH